MDRIRRALGAVAILASGQAHALDTKMVSLDAHPYEASSALHKRTKKGGSSHESLILTRQTSGGYVTIAAHEDSDAIYAATYDTLLEKLRPPKDSYVIAQHNHAYELVAQQLHTFGARPEDITQPDLVLTGPSDTDCQRIKKPIKTHVQFLNIVDDPGGMWFCKFPPHHRDRTYPRTFPLDARKKLFIGSQSTDPAIRAQAIADFQKSFRDIVGMETLFVPHTISKAEYSEQFFRFFGVRLP